MQVVFVDFGDVGDDFVDETEVDLVVSVDPYYSVHHGCQVGVEELEQLLRLDYPNRFQKQVLL